MKKHRKKREFKHLVLSDRNQIEILIKKGYQQVDVADVLGVHKTTIGREIKKHACDDGVYRASVAQHKADNGRRSSKYQGMKVEQDQALRQKIIDLLQERQSPDGIAGRLRQFGYSIGKGAIYKWLYSSWGQSYCKYLCMKRYRKKPQRRSTKHEMIPNRIPLAERLQEGVHWQGDCFVSPARVRTTACASVIVEEVSKFIQGVRMPDLKVNTMVRAVRSMLDNVVATTLTLDNGIENRGHELFGILSYFCEPYSPWEKPLVEQSIGLLRRWFIPKGTDLRNVSNTQLQQYIDILNHKYRKSLNYKSAYEVALENGIIKKIPFRVSLLKVSAVALHYRI